MLEVEMKLDDKYVLSPSGSSGTLWVHLAWDGKDPNKPSVLPDGRDWEDVIVKEGLKGLPSPIWLEPWNSGRLVDWLWPGLSERVFSQNMLKVFLNCGVKGIETLPLTIRRKRDPDIEGYSLVKFSGDEQVEYFPPDNPYGFSLVVSENIKEELMNQKLTGFTIQTAADAWEEHLANVEP